MAEQGVAGLGPAWPGLARVFITAKEIEMSKQRLFLGGLPTEPDVRKLIDAFPRLEPGAEISHAEIAKVIGVDRDSDRYRTVTNAWRRLLKKDHNVRLKALPGVGFKSIDGMERVIDNMHGFTQGARKIRKAADDVRRVEIGKLSQEQQRVAEHTLRHMEATVDHLQKTSKAIAIEFKPQAQLPRVRMVK